MFQVKLQNLSGNRSPVLHYATRMRPYVSIFLLALTLSIP